MTVSLRVPGLATAWIFNALDFLTQVFQTSGTLNIPGTGTVAGYLKTNLHGYYVAYPYLKCLFVLSCKLLLLPFVNHRR